MSGFQKLSDLAPVTMAALSNPQKKGETKEEYVVRILKVVIKRRTKGFILLEVIIIIAMFVMWILLIWQWAAQRIPQ